MVDRAAWVQSGSTVTLPQRDLEAVLFWGRSWRAWARDLVEAGDWQE